jgi:endonuclease YncB( thermonuclease family)
LRFIPQNEFPDISFKEKTSMKKLFLFLFLLTFASGATATVCRVVKIHDGDTITVRCADRPRTERVRFRDIDAPELQQAYGKQSRAALVKLCPRGSETRITRHGKGKYGRTIATLTCRGVDVQKALVRGGWAWTLRHSQDKRLFTLQREAKHARRGLWASPRPMAPWKWRHGGK